MVTGASGFLGWNVCIFGQKLWEVYGTYRTNTVSIPGVKTLKTDLKDFARLKSLVKKIRPDAVIHAAALSSPNVCEQEHNESYLTNVETSINLAGLCADFSIPCVFTSTDLVFGGSRAPYCEDDPVDPVCVYGEHKVLAEKGMLQRFPSTAVCRMPLMFGPTKISSSFLQPMLRAISEGRELKLFTDEFRTPISAKTAAAGLFLALEKCTGGIIHLGGRERICRFEFGQLLCELLEANQSILVPCLQKDVSMVAPRSADVSLDSARAFALGFDPPMLREALRETLKLIKNEKI